MTVKSHKLGPGHLTLGEAGSLTEFGAQLTACAVEPTIDEGDPLYVLSGEEIAGDDTEGFTLTGSLLQQYDKDSLLLWAFDNRGQAIPFKFVPDDGRDLAITGTVRVRPLKTGGDIKSRNSSDVSWTGVGMFKYIDAETGADLTYGVLAVQPAAPDEQPGDWA